MSLTAIIPVWNGRDHLTRLLASLEAQTQPASELLVVDNGSTDGAPELARRHGARVISMGRNAGFAPAVNRGIQESQTDWIAVLNSDVELAPDYFAILCATGSLFATGKILMARAPDRIDGAFDAVCRGGVAWRVGHGRSDGPAFAARRSVWSIPWTAALFRAELFRKIGLLNEAFESYLEDVEFGLRCAGRQINGLYVPEATAWHYGSAARGRWHPETVRLIARNQWYLVALHYSWKQAWAVLVAQSLWGLVAARHGAAVPWLRGKMQGLRGAAQLTREDPIPRDRLTESETLIRDFQRATGFDMYWRIYFRLAGQPRTFGTAAETK